MQTARSMLIIGFIVAFFFVCLVSYAEDVPEGIIFVDQSGSVKKYDPTLKSRTLLTAFLRTFKKPHRIVVAGFNEEIHEYVSVVTKTEADMETLAGEIQKIDASSYCTDLEIPLRYLVERDGKEAIEFALIISDGEPDIWDGKLRHFSKNVKSDPRYEDLNKQYRMLKASGLSPDELFDRLRQLYHERNLELIEEQLSRLGDGLGDRIIVWDVSGESDYLKNLAEKCGAQYLPMKTEQNLTPVDLLRYGALPLLARSSRIVREPPPPDLETLREPPIPTAVEARPDLETLREPPIPTPVEPKPEIGVKPKGAVGWTIAVAVALFVLIGWGGAIMLSRFRKKAAGAEYKKKLEAEIEAEIRSIKEQRLSEMEAELADEQERRMQQLEARESEMLAGIRAKSAEHKKELEAEVEGEIGSIKEQRLSEMEAELTAEQERRVRELERGESEMLSGTQAESAEAGWQDTGEGRLGIEDVQERVVDIVSASLKEVSNYIDDQIRRAMGDTEKLCDELIKEETKALEFDRRFSIRTPVPPGTMEVHWTNKDGTKMRGQAVNISMDAVLFEAPGFRAESIDRVVCPRLDVVLNVVRSRIHRMERDSVVAVLLAFEGSVDDSMRWVEIVAGIDEREEE